MSQRMGGPGFDANRTARMAMQVHKGFYFKANRFVAVKKINAFERVSGNACGCTIQREGCHMRAPFGAMRAGTHGSACAPAPVECGSRACVCMRALQDTRHQMLNDLKALIDAPKNIPGLVSFYGAYHVPESGQISIVLEYVDGGSLADVLAKVRHMHAYACTGQRLGARKRE